MGFTSNQTESDCKGKYQMVVMYKETGERLLMFDTHTAKVYEYDWTFNHWKQLTFGSHIVGH